LPSFILYVKETRECYLAHNHCGVLQLTVTNLGIPYTL
jgi:hypothetical protein